MNIDAILDFAVKQARISAPRLRNPKWSDDELAFLRENAGRLSDAEIGSKLGRSPNAVKVRRMRIRIPSISKARTEWLTARDASRMIGIDEHKITGFCRDGLLPHQRSGEQGLWYLINVRVLTAWAVNPEHWIYFNWRNIPDAHLRRLCELRSERWGDEWWTTAQAAEYHGVKVCCINNMAYRGVLPATQSQYSISGRNQSRAWKFWFIKRSDALSARPITLDSDMSSFTAGGDQWILRARELGYSFSRIGATMGVSHTSVANRYKILTGQKPRREVLRGQH